jgi:tetratricopeptide (TPR) repeat protein
VVLIASLAVAFTVWMAVEAYRREGVSRWLAVILLLGPIGALVYFFSEFAGQLFTRPVFETRQATVEDLRAAEADVAQADNAFTWTAYATALRARRQLDKAIDAARKGLEHDPAHLGARYELGLAHLEGGHHEEARAELEKVAGAEATFDSDRVLFVLSRAQQGCGDDAAARVSLETLAARSGSPEVLFECAVVQARLGDRAAAAENLQRIITEAEEVPEYLAPNVRPWVRRAKQSLRALRR